MALAVTAGPAPTAAATAHGTAGAKTADARAQAPAAALALTAPARALHQWVLAAGDNEGLPFVVIDKQRARLWLFDAAGAARGSTAVLLGLARGDASVPGIGERPIKDILPQERTTPAGRFLAEPGHNANGEDIFWVDYDAAVSMHRVRANNPVERRLQRLASPSPADNRISYGCINVPAAFYDEQLRALFGPARGVVYLLPETQPLASLFTPDPGAVLSLATPAADRADATASRAVRPAGHTPRRAVQATRVARPAKAAVPVISVPPRRG